MKALLLLVLILSTTAPMLEAQTCTTDYDCRIFYGCRDWITCDQGICTGCEYPSQQALTNYTARKMAHN
ncbi:unnamed protein product [Linum tenue]|uniref:ShKT domain-containing protein n=1 Tax=Linum tenue TaxID=586396 RepID=A0AAV0GNB6_9ROSI|nr:unnamed protein product [Linum tenue]